jgi:hypothetical protein
MGMRGYLRQTTPAELGHLRRNPEIVMNLLPGEGAVSTQFMATLARLQKEAAQARQLNLSPEEQEKLSHGDLICRR